MVDIKRDEIRFGTDGWRAVIADTFTFQNVKTISQAISEWIKKDLSNIGKDTPLVVSVHIPMYTMMTQVRSGSREANSAGMVIDNSKELLEILLNYNLKLVLQGHLHYREDIYIHGTHYITSGAVSGAWWQRPVRDCEEGFLLLKVKDNDFEWEYIDYGWEVAEDQRITFE